MYMKFVRTNICENKNELFNISHRKMWYLQP